MPLSSSDLNLLPPLRALLDERSVSRAAALLQVSQPTMSGYLSKLRTHFSDPLLIRRGSGYELTPLGQRLLEALPDVLLGAERLMSAQPGFDPANSEHSFLIYASDYATTRVGAPLLKLLEREAPNVRVKFANVLSSLVDSAPESLRSCEGVMLPHGYFTKVPHTDLISDEWACIVSADNDLIGDDPTAEELLAAPWITTLDGSDAFTPAGRQIQISGADPKITMVTPNFLAIPGLVAGSRHVALIQRSIADFVVRADGRLRMIELPFALAPIREALWWHRDREHDPSHVWLRGAMQRALDEFGPGVPV